VRKFIVSILAIILALGLTGAGALAYFQDTETSTGNTYTAGELDLKVNDANPDVWDDGCSGTWVLTDIVPGAGADHVDTVTANVYLKNVGSTTPDHLEIQASIYLDEGVGVVESDADPYSTATEMAKKIEIVSMTYNSSLLLAYWLNDADGDGVLTLNDMTYDPDDPVDPNGLDDLSIPLDGSFGSAFTMSLRWIQDDLDDNDFQGDTLELEVHFTLNQDAGQ